MTRLYQPDLYEGELAFEDAEPGSSFPVFSYAVSAGHLAAYVEGVSSGLDPELVGEAAASPMLPSLVALNFGFVYSAMRCRPPAGFLNSSLQLELSSAAAIDEPLVMKVTVADRQIKRERKHVVLEAVVTRQDRSAVSSARIGCIFP